MMEVEIQVALTNQLNILLFVLFYFRLYFILFSGIEMTLNLNTTTPIQDAQGRWYELLSPTQVLTGDNEIKSPSRKNKGYGDREAEACNKRTRDTSSTDQYNETLSQSLSELSISPSDMLDENEPNKIKRRHIPGYLKVSDHTFVRMLSKAINNHEGIIQWLNTKEKIDFFRQMALIMNDLYYYELQAQLWQDHYDSSLKEGIWGMTIARSYAKEHRVCRAYSFRKHIIEEGQLIAKNELQRNTDALHQCFLDLEEHAQHWQPSIDHYLLPNAIDVFVKQSQKRLRSEFAFKRKRLKINASDHYLIRSFYWLQPSQEQMDLAKKIWQVTADAFQMKQNEEILRQRIFLQQLPYEIDKKINQTMTSLKALLTNPILDKDRCTSLTSACSKLVNQYKVDVVSLKLQIMQDIRRDYQKVLARLMKELSEFDWIDSIKEAIIDRQNKIIQRYDFYLAHKLNILSVDASMVSD